ncbi:MAG TPA: hypothetical protein VK890_02245, partial [Bacteroidia bacterium]|nr:hypothetical protein [Bacteroidia bacterium]
MKRLLTLAIVINFTLIANAQNVGINTTGATPNASAILDLNTGNAGTLGFLGPQVALTSITVWAPVGGVSSNGMLVYNTAAGVGSGVGYYYWANAQWNFMALISNDWHLTGNAGTTVGTNFLGTTDGNNLMFKVNSQQSGLIDFTNFNTLFGYQAGKSNTGQGNTGVGYQALTNAALSGSWNTGIGMSALTSNTSGTQNTGIGEQALLFNAGGSYNTGLGSVALYSNTSGLNNTAAGDECLYKNTIGSSNAALG